MIDKRCQILLKIINEKCVCDSFRVITVDEFITLFPTDFAVDKEVIGQCLNKLKLDGFISVRFDNGWEYCLSQTPKGKRYVEQISEAPITKNSAIIGLLPYFYNFLSTFLAIVLAYFVIRFFGELC